MTDLDHAGAIARAVRTGERSAESVVAEALARIARFNPGLNAVVTLNERALDEARALDRRIARGEAPGILAGVPVGIKDVTQVAGVRTTFGSPLYRDHVPTEDALVVSRLRAAGAIIIGKTNTPEFTAGGNTWNDVFGRTRNPWNPALSAGGSTGGGAVALATGMIAIAEGTDLGGSLRIPASFCGVVGIRPSPGLVPTYPTDYVWDTLQATGPMARTAEEAALALQAMAGPSALTPLRQPIEGRDFAGAVRAGPKRGLAVAYAADPSGIGIDAGIAAVCRAAADALSREGVRVDEVPFDLSDGRDAFTVLRGHWYASWMAERLDHVDDFGVNVQHSTRAGLAGKGEALGQAELVRGRIWHRMRTLLERYDHLITPTMAVPPFPVEENYPGTVAGKAMPTYVEWLAPTYVLSLTGLPVASVPCGLDAGGLPVGMQIVGRPTGEEAVLALAGMVQRVRPIGAPPMVAAG